MSSLMASVARKEWTPRWGRWTLNAEGEYPTLEIQPYTHSTTKYEVRLFAPGCAHEEYTAWLGHWVSQLHGKVLGRIQGRLYVRGCCKGHSRMGACKVTLTMLEIALKCIARGWATFPCVPRSKSPRISREDGGHGYKDATLDEAQVRAWWSKPGWADSNVPIATGASGLCVLDIDDGIQDEAHLKEWMTEHGLPPTYAVRSGGRPEFKVHLYYSGTGLRSVPWQKDGCSGDIRCSTGLVIAAGGLHKSGNPYTVLWDLPVEPRPAYVETLTEKERKFDAPTDVDDATADDWKTWLYEYADRNKLELTGYESRVRNGWWLGIICPWVDHHDHGKGTDSSTGLGILDGRVTFNCMHGTCGHNAAAFKQLMALQNNEDTEEPGADVEVVLGSGNVSVTVTPEDFEEPEHTTTPVYPDDVWKGTPYGDFANYCSEGNFIRKRFFSESLRTVVGAVVGGQLTTDYQGVNARAYTVLIGPPGSGKGTAITAARQFVECDVDSQTVLIRAAIAVGGQSRPAELVLAVPQHRGACCESGECARIDQATRPHKLEKGESRNPMELWRPLPRFITIQEEIGGLFANFANENSGRGLETAILELYDRDEFTTTATNERSAKSGRLLYSVLGGIPKTEWDNIFARASSVGSGLFSRLNIIGTENDRTVAALPEYDFGEMQRVFLPRITALERTPARIPVSPTARGLAQ